MKSHIIVLIAFGLMCVLLIDYSPVQAQDEHPLPLLDRALMMAGTSRSECSISEPWESGYITGARMPVLVDTLANPFYLPLFTQVFGEHFSGSRGSVSPVEILENTFEMLNLDTAIQKPMKNEPISLVDALELLQTTHQRGLIKSELRENLAVQIEKWPTELQEAVTILVQAFTKASLERRKAIELLSKPEIEKLTLDIQKWVELPDFSSGNLFLAGVDEQWPTDLQLLRKVDYSHLFNAARIMAEAVEMTRTRLQAAIGKLDVKQHDELLLEFHSAAGTIIVGGAGINRYEKDAAMLIDLGGNDIYRNNAGGFIDAFDGVCCLIDMEGNDLYESNKTGNLAGAITSVSILVDYDGHDIYRAGCLSQGAAFCGVAMLYDESGNDTWTGSCFTQGAAAFGIGLAIDVGGDDAFICRSIGQGFGTTLGAGVMVNVAGDDTYSAGPAWDNNDQKNFDLSVFCQGSGVGFHSPDKRAHTSLYGGIGFLVDGRGDDNYISGNFSQGASRFGSMGLLIDCAGDDGYQSGNFSQGSAVDWSSASLIDQHGSDWYLAGDSCQGSAVNHSSGFLLDYDGDDKYMLNGLHGQGHARETSSLGLMIDYRGYDSYNGGSLTKGCTVLPAIETNISAGIFIDQRGNDTYFPCKFSLAENNKTWKNSHNAVGIDTPDVPEMYFAHERALSRFQHYDMSPVIDLESKSETSRLGSVDPYVCFHALAPVISNGTDSIPIMVKAMQRGHDSFRRIMEEGLGQILLDSSLKEKWEETLSPLILNLDPSTRQWCVLYLQNTGDSSLLEIIRPLLMDNDAKVRNVAIKTILYFHDTESAEHLKHIVVYDSEASNRLAALTALGKLNGERYIDVFRTALIDSSLAVHLTACEWVEHLNDVKSVGTLQLLVSNKEKLIRISAAETLIKLGQKNGFPVLIDALDTTRPLKSPHDNSLSLIDFLKEYSGQQLPWDSDSWREWWRTHEAGFAMKTNLNARSEYQNLFKTISRSSSSQLLRSLSDLKKKYPFYKGFNEKLAPWIRMKSKSALDKSHKRTARKLVKYAVEMNPSDPENWSMLSEILFAENDPSGAMEAVVKSIELDSKNLQYRKLRDIYRKALPEKNKTEGKD